ncbi:MAG: aldo/keto reductase [Chloroflexi bacterium]|nr:aldo/keto reductase [Chloroflexota bacterium]MCI0576231.1 aldo/keto reductase [Chloroflexota bacterium]MCI0645475.1 aldo/keto reductase [Chloroflexota bacterium]MCI0730614.1 aldo/keto reductase [Chloroflexota bacterium]
MEYRRLGRTGLKVSTICLGTMQFGWTADEATSHQIMTRAMELGCNFFDTADVYSSWHGDNKGGESETIIGNWLAESGVRRQDIIIATKVRGRMGPGPNDQGLSRQHILNAVEDSLERLQTDFIDLYQVHHPDEETPLEETLQALDDLVRAGMVRYIGCSNYPAWLLTKSLWISDVRGFSRFDSLQPHYNYVHRAEFELELQELCLDQGIGVIPYSPLGGGFLTGKYRRGANLPQSDRASGVQRRYMNERGFAALDRLEEIGRPHGATIAQTAIAWALANPAVDSAIIGANSIEQLEETMKGAEVKLSAEDKAALDEATAWEERN